MYFVSAENLGWKQNRFSFQSRHQWVFISEKYANLISNNYGVYSARSTGESVTYTDYVHRTNQNMKTEFPKWITHMWMHIVLEVDMSEVVGNVCVSMCVREGKRWWWGLHMCVRHIPACLTQTQSKMTASLISPPVVPSPLYFAKN